MYNSVCYVGWSGSWAKVIWKSVCFVKIKAINIWHFHNSWHVSQANVHVVLLIHESIWLPDNSSISGFDNVFTFLYIIIVYPCLIWYFFSICSCPLPCELFWALCSPCVPWLSLLLLWVVLLEYDCGFFNMVQDGIKWISLCVCVFPSLVVHAVFCCYRCWLDVLSVACDSPCSGDLNFVWPVVVIVIAISNNCSMGQWSPIFPFNCYSWPYRDRYKDLWSIIYCVIFALPVH